MRIAVTGENGLVGQAVVELASSQGHNIVNINRQEGVEVADYVTNLAVDTTNYDAFEAALQGCDALIHPTPPTSQFSDRFLRKSFKTE